MAGSASICRANENTGCSREGPPESGVAWRRGQQHGLGGGGDFLVGSLLGAPDYRHQAEVNTRCSGQSLWVNSHFTALDLSPVHVVLRKDVCFFLPLEFFSWTTSVNKTSCFSGRPALRFCCFLTSNLNLLNVFFSLWQSMSGFVPAFCWAFTGCLFV